MSGKKVTYYTLIAFIIGSIILAYVQYDSNKNINALISGNEKLLNELTISNELQTLEKDIFAVESKIRGVITTSNPELGEGTEEKKQEILAKIKLLHNAFEDDSSRVHLATLNTLINKKLAWSDMLITTFNTKGKKAAEDLINTQKGRYLTDSISATIQRLDATRQRYLKSAITSIDNNGQKAKALSTILIITLLIGAGISLWYTIANSKKQERLIRELNISERKVKESAQVKERFLANMSHEIRTPLNAILGFINLLQKKELDTEAADYVSTIGRSGENLLNIVNDILDLSKIEAQMMRVETTQFSMRGLIHSVQNMFLSKSAEKQVRIISEIDTSLPDILEGDATKLTQILINLIGNAIKFTHGGTITIKISNKGISGNSVLTGISISDTGIGIDKDKLGHIFERFQQAEDSVNRNYGGTGLGLTIVSELIRLQKGMITVESEPGKGTTFHVTLPYTIGEEAAEGTETGNSTADPTNFESIRLLVVEDNEINQKLIKHLFKNWNLAYDMAGNGREALQALQDKDYDMVLMDIQMPEMDGYTATQEIRKTLKLNVPVIAMTAHAFAGEKEKCLSFGMNDYIPKPIKENKLHELITRCAKVSKSDTAKITDTPAPTGAFNYISLSYLQEISGGDSEYEKSTTGVFIEQLPKELETLEKAWENRDYDTIKKMAHHLKTTVSIMGLNERLQANLDDVEYGDLPEGQLKGNIETILFTCRESLKEAKQFYSEF